MASPWLTWDLVVEVCEWLFLNKTSKIMGVGVSSLPFMSLQPFPQSLLGVLSFLRQQQSWISHLSRGLVHHPS